MIEIKNLVKEFKAKNKQKCIALDNVSFTLENKGLVFVLGKSGSGKTTLLSLIGTLDNITSGDIIVDGISLKNISEVDASSYRNERIAFIYQDYHLIDELTVKENIALSLELKDDEQDELIFNALKDVHLEGYESRYPKELSGGEKQRVAIARAIVKSSPIILADEPTGNLDTKTTKQIFDLLSKLAKDKLVLVVSHDLRSALTYADKIINIQDGKLINIVKRNENNLKTVAVKDNTLYLPQGQFISEEEELDINTNFSKFQKIKWFNNDFVEDNSDINEQPINKPLNKHHLKNKLVYRLGFKFFKKSVVSTVILSLIMMLLVNVLGLTGTLANYNTNKVISKELERNHINSLVVKKTANNDGSYIVGGEPGVFENYELKTLKDSSIKGNTYECVDLGFGLNYIHIDNLGAFLPFNGCVISERSFVNKLFNNGNEVTITYNPVQQDYGYFITDFEADQSINFKSDYFHNYNDFFKKEAFNHFGGYVNGIINTNYKVMFKDVMANYTKGILNVSKIEEASHSNRFIEFSDFANNYLIKKYTFNPNFKVDYIKNPLKDSVRGMKDFLRYNNVLSKHDLFLTNYYSKAWGIPIKGNEIMISPEVYYELTGIELTQDNYNKEFKPIDVTLEMYDRSLAKLTSCRYKEKFTIIAADFRIAGGFALISQDMVNKLNSYTINNLIGLYYDDIDNLNAILEKAKDSNFNINNRATDLINHMTKNVNTFASLFRLILFVLSSGILFLLIIVSLKSIKEQMHNIGILKSLGTRNYDLFKIFALKIFIICLLSSLLYSLTASGFISLADNILINSQADFASKEALNGLQLIIFEPYILGLNILFIFIVGIVSFLIEAIRLRNIKPINIIKAKE